MNIIQNAFCKYHVVYKLPHAQVLTKHAHANTRDDGIHHTASTHVTVFTSRLATNMTENAPAAGKLQPKLTESGRKQARRTAFPSRRTTFAL